MKKYGVKFPEPTTKQPSEEEVHEMALGLTMNPCLATDGCEVEPDGVCPHGHASWPRYLGII